MIVVTLMGANGLRRRTLVQLVVTLTGVSGLQKLEVAEDWTASARTRPSADRMKFDGSVAARVLDALRVPSRTDQSLSLGTPKNMHDVLKLVGDRPYDLVDRVNSTSVRMDASDGYQKLPMCDFSSGKAALPPWDSLQAKRHESFLDDLYKANISVVLTSGTLLGAYRHHGTIPFDEDMDMVFSVCENIDLVSASQGNFASTFRLTMAKWGKAEACKSMQYVFEAVGEHAFSIMLWNMVLKPLLAPSGIKMVDHTLHGIRLSNGASNWDGAPGGVGADLLITADALSEDDGSPQLCRCSFGGAYAYCSKNSREMLLDHYGETFMTPKSQCDYYRDIGHENWAWRSTVECAWASNTAFQPRS